jgi:hypothetical protein
MRSTLTTLSVAALLATTAGTAAAQPVGGVGRHDASTVRAAHVASGPVFYHPEGGPAVGVSTASVAATATPSVRTAVSAASDGFSWVAAAIGAGLAAALLLTAAGVAAARRHPPTMAAH